MSGDDIFVTKEYMYFPNLCEILSGIDIL